MLRTVSPVRAEDAHDRSQCLIWRLQRLGAGKEMGIAIRGVCFSPTSKVSDCSFGAEQDDSLLINSLIQRRPAVSPRKNGRETTCKRSVCINAFWMVSTRYRQPILKFNGAILDLASISSVACKELRNGVAHNSGVPRATSRQ